MSTPGPDTQPASPAADLVERPAAPTDVAGREVAPLARAAADVVPVRIQGAPAMGQDLVRAISETAAAVRFLDAAGSPAADITITAVTAPVCTGDTPADAFQAAADLARAASHLQINACSLARVPGQPQ
jgi:hypothetical protein